MKTVIITANLEEEIKSIRALEAKIAELDELKKEKESLIRQIIFFEKARLEEVKANKELMGLRNKLVELEKRKYWAC